MNTRSQRIGFLVKTFPKLSEGFILGEILGLQHLGVAPAVISLNRPREQLKRSVNGGVRAPVLYVNKERLAGVFSRYIYHALAAVLYPMGYIAALNFAWARRKQEGMSAFAVAPTVARMVRKLRLTHLHAHFASEPTSVAELVQIMIGLPFSISAHAKDTYVVAPQTLTRKMQRARFTVTCTEHNRAYLASLASPGSVVALIYHGIDLERFSPPQPTGARVPLSPPLILSVGQLREKQGFATLIEACGVLAKRGVAFCCEIVGDGELLDNLKMRIDALGLRQQISIIAPMAHEALIARYRSAAVFAAASQLARDDDRDGIPKVLLEAMATGLPVVTTPVSGIPEVVSDQDNGFLVPPEDAARMARALERLLQDDALAARLGVAANRTVAQLFSNERNLKLLIALFERTGTNPGSVSGAMKHKAYA